MRKWIGICDECGAEFRTHSMSNADLDEAIQGGVWGGPHAPECAAEGQPKDWHVSWRETILIPECYRQTIENFIREYASRRTWEIEQAFLGIQVGMITDELAFGSALADQLAEIARAADGQMAHTEDGWTEGVLYEGIQDLMERLFCPPGLGTAYDIPARFWETDLGQMVARAMLWIRGDELITLKAAAELRGVSVQAISQAITAGRLRRYVDPDAPARQGRVLVSRREALE